MHPVHRTEFKSVLTRTLIYFLDQIGPEDLTINRVALRDLRGVPCAEHTSSYIFNYFLTNIITYTTLVIL